MLDESTRKLAHRRPDSRETAQQEGGGKSRIRLHIGRAMVRRGVAVELAGPMAFESHEFIRMTPIRALTREPPQLLQQTLNESGTHLTGIFRQTAVGQSCAHGGVKARS